MKNNSWTCPQCGTVNNARFCVSCGTRRPELFDEPAVSEPLKEETAAQPAAVPEETAAQQTSQTIEAVEVVEPAEPVQPAPEVKTEVKQEMKPDEANADKQTEVRSASRNTEYSPYPKASAPKQNRSHPVLAALLTAVIGAAAGFGGGMVAAKKYAPQPTVINQNAPAQETAETTAAAEPSTAPVVAETTAAADSGRLTIQEIAESASKSVVEINTESTVTTSGFFGGTYSAQAAGSGVIISDDGYIITNDHVVEGAQSITVTTYEGTKYDAKLIGTDAKSDIAVIKIDAENLYAAVIGDSDQLRVGDTAVVIGNPLGTLGGTVTDGIISATNRDIVINNQSMNLIQTNAEINSGNSGGGMFDAYGKLVGIVNAKDSGMTNSGTVIEGIGFAIPINTANMIAQDLIQNGYVTSRPTIGVGLSTLDYDYNNYKAGLYVSQVYEGGAAEAAGIQTYDRIIAADGTEVSTYTDLTRVLTGKAVGDEMVLTIERNGEQMEVTLTLTGALDSMRQN